MKVGFTGTRHALTPNQLASLESTLANLRSQGATELHHGDCKGADAAAHEFARQYGYRVVIHPPSVSAMRAYCDGDHWEPPLEFLARNRAIVEACDLLIACPQLPFEQARSGTWATVRYARKLGRRTCLILPNGQITGRECQQ